MNAAAPEARASRELACWPLRPLAANQGCCRVMKQLSRKITWNLALAQTRALAQSLASSVEFLVAVPVGIIGI